MKKLDGQLNLMVSVIVYVEICARGNVLIYCTESTGINMQNLEVAEVLMLHTGIVM